MIKAMVSWADVAEVQSPCWTTFQNMRFEVQQRHIDAWRDDPDGVWALVRVSPPHAPPLWALGTFFPTEYRRPAGWPLARSFSLRLGDCRLTLWATSDYYDLHMTCSAVAAGLPSTDSTDCLNNIPAATGIPFSPCHCGSTMAATTNRDSVSPGAKSIEVWRKHSNQMVQPVFRLPSI
jgi:hypothetical protein